MSKSKELQRKFLENFNFSFFDTCHSATPTKTVSLFAFLSEIRSGKAFGHHIQAVRQTSDKKGREALKKRTLPCVTISGVFAPSRNKANLTNYSGLMQVDFDSLPDIDAQRELLKKDGYTLAMFNSPSGNGLKLIVKTENQPGQHETAFQELKEYYKNSNKEAFFKRLDEAKTIFKK